MRTVTHREMRNQSGELLRLVAQGESVQITNRGQVAALMVPPDTDILAGLVARGEARPADRPVSSLSRVKRRRASHPSGHIIDDVRGRW